MSKDTCSECGQKLETDEEKRKRLKLIPFIGFYD